MNKLIEKWKGLMQYSSPTHKPVPEEDYALCASKLEEFEQAAIGAGFPSEKMAYVVSSVLHSYKENPKPVFEQMQTNVELPEGVYKETI